MPFRGTNIAPVAGEVKALEQLHAIKEAGANSCRWSLYADPSFSNNCTISEWRNWLVGELDKVSRVVPTFTQLGMFMILDLHTNPGGNRLWVDGGWQDEFIQTWKTIAECCVSQPNVPLYDLLNEPLPLNQAQWVALALKAQHRIWAVEPGKRCTLSSRGASPNGFSLLPYIPGFTYTFHFYDPGSVTGQGIPLPGWPPHPREYTDQDSQIVRTNLNRARAYQVNKLHGAPVLVGELDCVRWVPGDGTRRWMRDVISRLNLFGWHWSFLLWGGEAGGADFWDQGFDTNFGPPQTPWSETDRIQLLKRGFRGDPL